MKLLSLPLVSLFAAAATAASTNNLFSILGPTGAPFFRNSAPAPGSPENHIPIREYYFAATGANTRTQRPPITVIRGIDNASPLLLTALINNNVLREVSILSLFDTTVNGQQASAGYNQVLSGVRIAGIETHATADGVLEKLTFSYDKLLSYYSDGNSSTIANWG